MVELGTIQAVSYIMGSMGVFVAAFYYIFNLRNTRKTHELQAFMQVFDRFNNKEFWNELDDMMKREWVTYDDYENKYREAGGNIVFPTLEGLGVLLKRKLIDASVPWDLFGYYIIQFWDKYLPIITERRRIVAPDYCIWTEHLVKEVRRYVAEHPESNVLPGSK